MYGEERASDPMVKFTFIKGEGERTFFAAGAYHRHGRYWDYEITGIWFPPLEDGKIPVEMTIDGAVLLEGTFDPEDNSMRGTTYVYGTEGVFVFKRDPDFVRFYPSPCVVNARTRWEFATTSVLDRVRQRVWSSKRISKRIEAGGRFMELTLRNYYGRPLEWEEFNELLTLFPSLYESDIQFYHSLINVHLKDTTIFE
jgi:hypothetical protein